MPALVWCTSSAGKWYSCAQSHQCLFGKAGNGKLPRHWWLSTRADKWYDLTADQYRKHWGWHADQCGVGRSSQYLLLCDWEDCSLDQNREQYNRPSIAVWHMHLVQITLQSNSMFCNARKLYSPLGIMHKAMTHKLLCITPAACREGRGARNRASVCSM